ncbi:GEVED domain-containing protein, partial [Flavobacteriales bacterium]|nr:GEVED domain-containing protein [Flavobacteriales bacterium]
TVNTINPTDVDLSWDESTCTANYSFRYKENTSCTNCWINPGGTINNTGGTQTYNLSGLTNLTTYNWKVKCGGSTALWVNGPDFTTPSSCPSTISQNNTGFHINPVYGYGNNPLNQSIDTLAIINLSNCELNIRPEFIISHQDSAIEQDDFTLKWWNQYAGPNGGWLTIQYSINTNGDAVGFWNYPASTDSSGLTLNIAQSTSLIIRIHFNNAAFNPNQNLAPLGNYSATWNTQEVDSLGNIIQTLATDTIPLALVDCSTWSVDSTSFTNNNCFGDSSGSATIFSIANGSGQYTYTWSDGQTTATATNLAPGTYTCLVIDDNWGCGDPVSFTLAQVDSLDVTLTGTNVTCWGNDDGTLAAIATGGSGSYKYTWDQGLALDSTHHSGLTPSLYTLTLTDYICGNNVTASFYVTEPDSLQSNTISSQNSSCDSLNCNGSISLNLSGGNTPYSISWNNGDSLDVRNNLCGGTYIITVNDSNPSCPPLTINANISNTPSLPLVAISGQDISCSGNTDGSASISEISNLSYCDSEPGDNTNSNIELVRIIGDGDSIVNNTAGACDSYEDYTVQYTTLTTGQSYSVDVNLGSCNVLGGVVDSAKVFIDWNMNGDFTDPTEMVGAFGGVLSPTSNTISFIVPNGYYGATRMRVVSQYQGTGSGPVTSCDVGTFGTSYTQPWFGATEDYTIIIRNSSNLSSYLWNTGDTTQAITGLLAGTYYCTLTDNSGCSNTDTIEIIEPSAINVTESITHIDCNGANNGTVTLFVTGGSSPYTINWNGSDTNALIEGQHNYIITDNNGCIFSDSIFINEPAGIILTSLISNSISCHGDSDGSIDLSVSGGSGVYFYSWTGPNGFSSSDSNITNLFSGEYIVTVNDINNCSAKDTITIDPVASLLITLNNTSDQTSCAPFDGSINISVSGGSGTYSYSWSNGDTTEDITNLSANTYILSLSDNNNCFIQDTFTIDSQTIPILVSFDSSNYNGAVISCNDSSNGYLVANTSGGLGNLTLLWSNSSTSDTIFNLSEGLYSVTVSDSIGCSNSESIYIHEPQEISVYRQQNQASCISQNQNIGITLVITGGTPGYSENWFGINPDSLILNTQYTYTITDTNNCAFTDTFTLSLATPLVMTSFETDVACYGDSTGAAYFQVSGGVIPYSYQWSNGDTTAIATNLPEGIHTCIVTDNNGCSKIDSTIISQPSLPIFTILSVIDSINCFGDNTGTANISVTGGVSPYNLVWSNLQTDTISIVTIATNLTAGFTYCTITDDNNCVLRDSIFISENDSLYAIDSISDYNNYSVSCNGLNDGSINISIIGGFGPFNLKWNNVADSTYIDSLSQGTYQLEIEDSLGCQFSEMITITEPSQINMIETHEDASCNGYNDGSLSFSINGGVSSYSISGSTVNPSLNSDTLSIDSLYASTQIFTIIDFNNCMYIDSIIISEPAALFAQTTLSDYNGVNVSCKGQSNGFIILDSVANEIGPYNFYWTDVNGVSLSNFPINDSLSVGNYSLTIMDSSGCPPLVQNFFITEPNFALISEIDSFDVTCNNYCDGTLIPRTFDGTPPYSYNWTYANGLTDVNDTINNLCAGNYDLLVTDANGCINTLNSVINEPTPVSIQLLSLNNVSVNGNNDGSIFVQANGGNGSFSYSWNNGGNTDSIFNLITGQYNVMVVDTLGCSDSSFYLITEPLALTLNFDSINSYLSTSCYDSCNGSIYINPVFSPLATFTTYWNGPNGFSSTDEDIFNLCAGVYNLSVISAGDSTHFIFEVIQPNELEVSIYSDSILCYNGNALSTAYTYGGTLPYSFAWSDSTSNISTILSAGIHNIQITDVNGCIVRDTITLLNPDTMIITTTFSSISCHNGSDGIINLLVNQGASPYIFSVNNGISYQSNNNFNSLPAGNYTIKIKDSNNCSQNTNITIDNPLPFTATIDMINSTNVSCYGLCDAIPIFLPTNAIGSLTQDWGTNNPPPLCAGAYSCLLTDGNGCITTVNNITISQPGPLVLTLSNQDTTTCNNNGNDGLAQAIIQGGTSSYNFLWSNGEITQSISNLIPGVYNVEVTDVNGCSTSDNITIINNPTPFLIGITYNSNILSADSASGGVPNSYVWNTSEITQNISPISNGQYWVIAESAIGCISDTAFYNVNDLVSGTTSIQSTKLKIFPNPSSGLINIYSEDIIAELSMINNIGEEVLFKNITPSKLDISHLPSGIYFIRLKVNNEIVNHKILLQ